VSYKNNCHFNSYSMLANRFVFPNKEIGASITDSEQDCCKSSEPENTEFFIRKAFEKNPHMGCELLFRTYYNNLCSHAVRIVYSKQVAEDIVGEVFLVFWKNKVFDTIHLSYRSYLFAAVRNRAYNHLRSEIGRKLTSLSDFTFEEGLNGSDQPDQILQLDELINQINETVKELPPQARRVFTMSRYEGKSHLEIAKELNINSKTVESHITRALGSLRKLLK
jgi:RNA polymerase sigma-70 factor (family 1)